MDLIMMVLLPDTRKPLSGRANFTWNFAGKLAYAGSRAFMLIMIAKLGSVEMVGQYSLAFAVTTPVYMMTDLDLRSVLVTDVRNQYRFGHYLGLRCLTTLLALFIVSVLSLWQQNTHTGLVILLIGLSKAFEAFADVLYGVMQREERLDKLGMSLMLKSVLSILLMGFLLWRFQNMVMGALGLAAAFLIILIVYDIPVTRPHASVRIMIDRNVIVKLLRLCLPLGIVLLFVSLNKNMSTYFIQAFLGSGSVGYYASIVYIMSTGSMVISALGQARNARMARLYERGDTKGFMKIVREMLLATCFLGVCMLMTSALFGKDILTILYRPEYAAYQSLFIFIMGAAALSYMSEVVQYAVTATRQFALQPFAYGGVMLAGLLLNVIFIPWLKLTGAAWCLLITACLQLAVNWLILSRMVRRKKASALTPQKADGEAAEPMLRVEPVDFPNLRDPAFIAAWKDLLSRNGNHIAYSDPDWLCAWWDVFGTAYEPLTLAAYAQDELIAVFPLMFTRKRGCRYCSFIGHPQATQTGVALNPDYVEEAVSALFHTLDGLKGQILFDLCGFDEQSFVYAALQRRLKAAGRAFFTSSAPCPVIPIGGQDYDAFIRARFSPHTMKNNRRDEKRLAALGTVSVRELSADDMPAAFSLHDARWHKKLDTSGFCDTLSQSFFTRLLSLAKTGWKALALGIYLDNRLIAFQYGFSCGGRATLYKSAHDDLLGIYAPGKMIKREFIRRRFEEGLTAVDLGIGYEEYKMEWTNAQETVCSLSFPNTGAYARFLFFFSSLRNALRAQMKKSRRVVLFKRNGLGRLRYALSIHAARDFFRRAVAEAACHGFFAALGERLHLRRFVVLSRALPASVPALNIAVKADLADVPVLSLLMGCTFEEIMRKFYRQNECYLIKKQGVIVCAAFMSSNESAARIENFRTNRKLCSEQDITALLSDVLDIIAHRKYKSVSLVNHQSERVCLRAAAHIGFGPAADHEPGSPENKEPEKQQFANKT